MMDVKDFARAVSKLMAGLDPSLKGCAIDTMYEAVKARLHASAVAYVNKGGGVSYRFDDCCALKNDEGDW